MQNPFDLNHVTEYLHWRERKLANAITDTNELIVEIRNPHALTTAERAALLASCRRSNMAIYATQTEGVDEDVIRKLGQQLGLNRMDANWLAENQGITHITVRANDSLRRAYIPYTNRAIKWHTDGYYNPPGTAGEKHDTALLPERRRRWRESPDGSRNRLFDVARCQ